MSWQHLATRVTRISNSMYPTRGAWRTGGAAGAQSMPARTKNASRGARPGVSSVRLSGGSASNATRTATAGVRVSVGAGWRITAASTALRISIAPSANTVYRRPANAAPRAITQAPTTCVAPTASGVATAASAYRAIATKSAHRLIAVNIACRAAVIASLACPTWIVRALASSATASITRA